MRLQLRARLIGRPSISSILASATAVSWHERAASLGFPSIVLTQADPGRDYVHGGADGLDEPRIQFDLWALDPDVLEVLAPAVIAEMEQARDVDGVRFHEAMLTNEFSPPPETLPDGTRAYRITQEWEFFFENLS